MNLPLRESELQPPFPLPQIRFLQYEPSSVACSSGRCNGLVELQEEISPLASSGPLADVIIGDLPPEAPEDQFARYMVR